MKQAETAAPATDHRDVLLAIDFKADWRGLDTGTCMSGPQLIAIVRAVSSELTVRFTLENQVARCR